MDQKREFTGVWIPKEIIEDDSLNGDEKMLYADIASFENCFILNETFAKRYKVSERTIQNRIKKLKDKGFVVEIAFNGRTRTLKSGYAFSWQTRKNLRGRGEETFVAEVKESSPIDNNIDNIEKTINTTPTPFQGETDENFISFWSEYPKRVAKPSAVKAFQKAMKKTDLPTILIAIRKYKKTDQWRKDKGQFIPNPATWLNQERWEDETGGTSSGSLRDFF
jgi:DNA-binding Lrp family transcriptional regulator